MKKPKRSKVTDYAALRVRLVPTFKHVEAFQYFFYWQFQGDTEQLLLIVFHVYLRNAVFIYI